MRFPGFIGPTYQLESLNIDCQRCYNLIPQKLEMPGKEGEQFAYFGAPGLNLLATIGSTGWRGLWRASTGILYGVIGNTLYKISSAWVGTSLGTLSTSSGQVSMADDGINLIIVDGTYGYDYNFQANTFTRITDLNFNAASLVVYQQTYFIFTWDGTQRFFLGLSTIQTGDPQTSNISFKGDIGSKSGEADNLIAIATAHENLWLFGDVSTEIFFNSGDLNDPFQQISGAFIDYGLIAKFSLGKIANTLFWLGGDENGQGVVVMADGYMPKRVSNHAVEQAIQSYSDISDAVAWTYQENGHDFYVLNFPTGNATWAFDSRTGLWHERAYLNNGSYDRHRGICHAFAYGVHVIGDYANGNLYQLSSSIYSDNGNPIPRRRRAPHLSSDKKRIFHQSFELDMETGVGLDGIAQGTDPQVMLRYSDDGGHSWSSEIWVSMGKIGLTKWRAKWNRLGQARDRVYEITITDPIKVAMIGAEIDIEVGAS